MHYNGSRGPNSHGNNHEQRAVGYQGNVGGTGSVKSTGDVMRPGTALVPVCLAVLTALPH